MFSNPTGILTTIVTSALGRFVSNICDIYALHHDRMLVVLLLLLHPPPTLETYAIFVPDCAWWSIQFRLSVVHQYKRQKTCIEKGKLQSSHGSRKTLLRYRIGLSVSYCNEPPLLRCDHLFVDTLDEVSHHRNSRYEWTWHHRVLQWVPRVEWGTQWYFRTPETLHSQNNLWYTHFRQVK